MIFILPTLNVIMRFALGSLCLIDVKSVAILTRSYYKVFVFGDLFV